MGKRETLSPSDYERLLSTDVELWNDDELSQFLVWDLINVMCNTAVILGDVAPDDLIKDVKVFVDKYKKYLFVFRSIDCLFQKLHSFFGNKKGREMILFQHLRLNFINESRKQYSVGLTVQGKKDRLFAIKNFINHIGTTDLYLYIYNYLKERNAKHLHELVDKATERLKSVRPDYIAFGSDGFPVERALILAAKRLSIPTLVFQDGLQDPNFQLFDCVATDYILVWGKYFKDLWIRQAGKKPENIYILGYPHHISSDCKTNSGRNYTLCYLGQDWERYNPKFLPIKIEILNQLSEMCKRLGLKFVYRPHPGDKRALLLEKLAGVEFAASGELLEQTFKKADVFVSFSSTTLVEAAMRGGVALQLMNYPIETNNLEQAGVCNKSFKTIDKLEEYLIEIISAGNLKGLAEKFNNNYIETRYDPGKRFLEIIKDIGNKNKKSI